VREPSLFTQKEWERYTVPTLQSFKSVVEVELDNGQLDWWARESAPFRAALVEHYGREVAGDALTPPPDPAALRARLRTVAPRLARLTDRIRSAFDEEQACAVVVPGLGLAGVELDHQRKGVFGLAALLGDLTANVPLEHVVWDVKARVDEKTGHTSFSENDHKADYHTDNGALPIPERFFLLYAVRAAEAGGGVSVLRDIRVIQQQLRQTPEGRAAIRVLTETKLPKRIPSAFRKDADVAADGYQYTAVFADKPQVRWRTHGLYKGLTAQPEYDTPEVRSALDAVRELLENGTEELRRVLPTDGLLVVNNHVALHGRTAFTDPRRHLLRLRFHEPSA
jgi:alpha-ketoglutarate-dependent taurine dioxygenase